MWFNHVESPRGLIGAENGSPAAKKAVWRGCNLTDGHPTSSYWLRYIWISRDFTNTVDPGSNHGGVQKCGRTPP